MSDDEHPSLEIFRLFQENEATLRPMMGDKYDLFILAGRTKYGSALTPSEQEEYQQHVTRLLTTESTERDADRIWRLCLLD